MAKGKRKSSTNLTRSKEKCHVCGRFFTDLAHHEEAAHPGEAQRQLGTLRNDTLKKDDEQSHRQRFAFNPQPNG